MRVWSFQGGRNEERAEGHEAFVLVAWNRARGCVYHSYLNTSHGVSARRSKAFGDRVSWARQLVIYNFYALRMNASGFEGR